MLYPSEDYPSAVPYFCYLQVLIIGRLMRQLLTEISVHPRPENRT